MFFHSLPLDPSSITWVLAVLIDNLFPKHQAAKQWRSFWNLRTVSDGMLWSICMNTTVSSAYINVLQNIVDLGRLLMVRMKKSGPKIEPWGTPVRIGLVLDLMLLRIVSWEWLNRYEWNQDIVNSVGISRLMCSRIRAWSKVSKAFPKSIKVARLSPTLFIMVAIASVVDNVALNPNCFHVSSHAC